MKAMRLFGGDPQKAAPLAFIRDPGSPHQSGPLRDNHRQELLVFTATKQRSAGRLGS
jgi:hypothetical protein